MVHLVNRTVSFIEQRLRVHHHHFCNGSHSVAINSLSENVNFEPSFIGSAIFRQAERPSIAT